MVEWGKGYGTWVCVVYGNGEGLLGMGSRVGRWGIRGGEGIITGGGSGGGDGRAGRAGEQADQAGGRTRRAVDWVAMEVG